MRSYWFTIAAGADYQIPAERLRRSLERHGIELDIIRSPAANAAQAKRLKIEGMLNSPKECDRVVYLDADTLVLDPAGIDQINGSWRIPWRISKVDVLPRQGDPDTYATRFSRFYDRHGLTEFGEGGELEGVEWNSGVIAGDRETIVALAREWRIWWDRILDLYDGRFRRDQLSYRIAYSKIGLHRRHPDTFPARYNWIASYFGINPNANILHRTMVRKARWLEADWERFVADWESGGQLRTQNMQFDYSGIARAKPDIDTRTQYFSPEICALLRQTYAFAAPLRVLIFGGQGEAVRYRRLLEDMGTPCEGCDSIEAAEHIAALPLFDLIVFCGATYVISESLAAKLGERAVLCFAGVRDMSLYRYLHRFRYVRILDPGFGVFSNAPDISAWTYAFAPVAGASTSTV